MHFVHLPHGSRATAVDSPQRPETCPECGHPAAVRARTSMGRALRRIHPSRECYYSMYEYSVLRDESCGCRSEAHVA